MNSDDETTEDLTSSPPEPEAEPATMSAQSPQWPEMSREIAYERAPQPDWRPGS